MSMEEETQRRVHFKDTLVEEKIVADFEVECILLYPDAKSYIEVKVPVDQNSPLLHHYNLDSNGTVPASLLLKEAYTRAKELLLVDDPTSPLLPLLGS